MYFVFVQVFLVTCMFLVFSQPKLTMAKCRRNVENFLEACRRIGVPQVSHSYYLNQRFLFNFNPVKKKNLPNNLCPFTSLSQHETKNSPFFRILALNVLGRYCSYGNDRMLEKLTCNFLPAIDEILHHVFHVLLLYNRGRS